MDCDQPLNLFVIPDKLILYSPVMVAVLAVTELLYFRIAVRLKIIDKPNERSSHQKPVIRGGGIIFLVALLIWFCYGGFAWPWFMIGVTSVAIVSFADDILSLSPRIRFTIHLIAVLLMFYQLSLFGWPVALVIVAAIVCIGALNAFNFMDGINGITGVYALVSLLTFLYIHYYSIPFTDVSLVVTTVIGVVVFLFFNFRKQARCFAGDVGSVTIAFVQIFLLLQLIYKTGNYAWALLFLVFGTDSVVTILYRLKNKENIFKPHRTHLYQYLSNDLKIPHLWVSTLYGIIQLAVNSIVIRHCKQFDFFTTFFLISYIIVYFAFREIILKHLHRPGFISHRTAK
jgi:UDP-GlcNAc:undecaprenyl-phosphate GlcNAc-1-phosphate transferase